MKLSELAKNILLEDQSDLDISTKALGFLALKTSEFNLIAKEAGAFSGASWVEAISLMANIEFKSVFKEGDAFVAGDVIVSGDAPVSELLAVERSFLNVLQQTCGVATKTNLIVEQVKKRAVELCLKGDEVPKLYHTRKTLPLLRDLQIQAVLAGGAHLHRRDLSSRLLFKDNHRQLIEDSGETYANFLKTHLSAEELSAALVETDTPEEAIELKKVGVKNIMLDNFSPELIKNVLPHLSEIMIEVSGGINEQNICDYVIPGVRRISLGCLTHSVKALDISLEIR